MPRTWIRVDCNTGRHGWTKHLTAAQRWGWVAFLLLCKETYGSAGIKCSYVDAEWCESQKVTAGDMERVIELGIADGAIRRQGDRYIIVNWKQYQPDPSNAERQAEWRKRHSGIAKPHSGAPVTPVTLHNENKDNSTVQYSTGRDVTGRDRTEREKQAAGAANRERTLSLCFPDGYTEKQKAQTHNAMATALKSKPSPPIEWLWERLRSRGDTAPWKALDAAVKQWRQMTDRMRAEIRTKYTKEKP